MSFLNLTLAEFLAALGAAWGIVAALYLLDRSRRRVVVASLRLWTGSDALSRLARRRRIRQPWSLLLQLGGVLLVLAAAAGLRFGPQSQAGRDHVILLDTSAWMGARGQAGSLLEEAKRSALLYVRSMPAADRAMVVRAAALAAPATRFESDRSVLENAIRQTRSDFTSLRLADAVQFAREAQKIAGRVPGEIVYAGPGRISRQETTPTADRLRVLPISEPADNCGIRKITLRRADDDPEAWEIFVAVRNYGRRRMEAPLLVQFAGALIGSRRFALEPGEEKGVTFRRRTRAGGWIDVRLPLADGLAADNQARVEVPAQPPAQVLVYSTRADVLRPFFAANPNVQAAFADPRAYDSGAQARLIVLDRFNPPTPPKADTIWIEPPAGSPFPIAATVKSVSIERWHGEHSLGAGLWSKDIRLETAQVFSAAPGDLAVADCARGPLIVARPGAHKALAIGFDPAVIRLDVTAPLLFANILRWMAPDIFRRWEWNTASVGAVSAALDTSVQPGSVRVVAENGRELPFSFKDGVLNFFVASQGSVRVLAANRESDYSLTLPDVADGHWQPPASALRRPALGGASRPWPALWTALAGVGAMLWIGEWLFFGRRKPSAFSPGGLAETRGRHKPEAYATARLVLKFVSILCVAIALFAPKLRLTTSRMAVAVLADASESMSDADLARASQLASAIEAARGRNWVRVIPFARSPRPIGPKEYSGGWKLQRTAGEAGRVTDLEAALRSALAAMPAGHVPRVALISDGKENRGSVARYAALFQQQRIPIDTFALHGRPKPDVAVEAVTMPSTAFTGEKFAIDLTVRSPRRAGGVIEIAAEGKPLGSSPVNLEPGTQPVRVYATISEPGAIDVTGAIRIPGSADARFSRALALRRPKLLYVSQDPPGTEQHLLDVLRAAGLDIASSQDALRPKLGDYQLVILNNWDIESLPERRKQEIEAYVKRGGGLLVIGGENNLYPERDRTQQDALERALPATIAPPRSPETNCVVLLIDKSESMMQGRKIELARLGAIGIIENLRPTDMIGVIIFDNQFRWVFPIGRVEDRAGLERLVSGIEPNGGTQIPPALAEAYNKIAPVEAAYKHIVLLTDGVSEEGNSYGIAKQAAARNISISTIGLGKYINQPFLQYLAAYANGKSYFLEEPTGLEQILLRDVQDHTQSTAVEKDLAPVILKKVELLAGVGMESAPPLAGYVRFKAKPAAETILAIDKSEPLLARWQYGLGRAAVFTSDAKSRWASKWVSWEGFDRFWSNLAHDLLPRAQSGEAALEYDAANHELVVDYSLGPDVEAPSVVPEIFAFGPEEFRQPVDVRKVAEGRYRGRVAVGDLPGLYRVRPSVESPAFPEAGLYRGVDELSEFGSDEMLLRRIAESTGGRFNSQPRQVFDPGGRAAHTTLALWPGLLALAILLNIAELCVRKAIS